MVDSPRQEWKEAEDKIKDEDEGEEQVIDVVEAEDEIEKIWHREQSRVDEG